MSFSIFEPGRRAVSKPCHYYAITDSSERDWPAAARRAQRPQLRLTISQFSIVYRAVARAQRASSSTATDAADFSAGARFAFTS